MPSKRLIPLRYLSFLVILLFWTTLAVAVPITYYVNVGTGSDTNNGTSSGTPFKFITKAMSVAISGDTILVAPGTYFVLPSC